MATDNTTVTRYSVMPSDEPEPHIHNNNLQGTSDTSSISVNDKRSEPNAQSKRSNRKKLHTPHTRLTDILLAFAIVFVPMAGISLILLGLTFYGDFRAQFPGTDNERPELPILQDLLPPTNAFYTTIGVSNFLSVGSWSSTVAEAVIAPFTLMFSFFIAQMAVRRAVQDSAQPSDEVRAIFKTPYQGSWYWIKSSVTRSNRAKKHGLLSTYLAGFGVLFAILLTILVVTGDQWLHFTTTYDTFRYYDTTSPNLSVPATSPLFGLDTLGYKLLPTCLDPSDFDLPCSLTRNRSVTNVMDPTNVYLLLLGGVNRMTSDFQDTDFQMLATDFNNQEASLDQIVNYIDPSTNLSHSILFYLPSAQEYDNSSSISRLGLDYVATTTSMSTDCSFATKACGLRNITDPSEPDQQLLYDCFPSFQGDLENLTRSDNTSAPTPIEVVRGWNTSFYQFINGTQQPVSLREPLNPFTFSAVADLNSFPFSSFTGYDAGDVDDGDVINAGSGHLAFALNCTASVYDVTYSLIDGNITQINKTLSDPRKAAVIRAPLQAGFGANYLYQQASFATISTRALLDLMADAFSQAGIAGSYGVFEPDATALQRVRYDWTVTIVNKAALIFQVTVCMLYAAVGLVIMVVGLAARRSEAVREYQVKLLPPAVAEPRSLRDWLLKLVGWLDDDLEDVESFGEDVKDEFDNQRDRRAVERADGLVR